MSGVRAWAPAGDRQELVGDSDLNTSKQNSSIATINSPVAGAFVPPHPPRPLRKLASLSSPSRLDEAIAAQAVAVSTSSSPLRQQQQQQATASSPSANAAADDEPALSSSSGAARLSVTNNNSIFSNISGASRSSSIAGNNLLSVAANRRCDAFLEKIRMTSDKSGEAARMGDVAAATARRAVDAHSPSRGGGAARNVVGAAAVDVYDNSSPGAGVVASPATTPSKFSARIALAQQRMTAAVSSHVVTTAPEWNARDSAFPATAVDREPCFVVTGQSHLANIVGLAEPPLTANKSSIKVTNSAAAEEEQLEPKQRDDLLQQRLREYEQQMEQQKKKLLSPVTLAPLGLKVAGAGGVDALDPSVVTALLEEKQLRCPVNATELTLAAFEQRSSAGEGNLQQTPAVVASGGLQTLGFVDGALADGAAVAHLIRGLCPVKIKRERYFEPKTEEELEEEKAQREEQETNNNNNRQSSSSAANDDEEDDVTDAEYQAPALKVPEHALPPPRVPSDMKELTRYVAKKRDGTSVSQLIIAKSPLAFVTRSGGAASSAPSAPSASAVAAESATASFTLLAAAVASAGAAIALNEAEEAMLAQVVQENAEAVCDAPTAIEALGKYILSFRPELEYNEDEELRMRKDYDMAVSEADQFAPAGPAAVPEKTGPAAIAAAAFAGDAPAGAGDAGSSLSPDSEAEAAFFAKPAPLRRLDLSDNGLGAVFPLIAPALAQAASLRALNLRGNGFGNPVACLEEMLPRGVGGDGPVGGEEAAAEDIAAGLEQLVRENKFLMELNLADNDIMGELATRLIAALSDTNLRVPTPPPEDPPAFEAYEEELPPPEFEGDDEVIPTESELDRQERADAAGDEGEGDENKSGAAAAAENDEENAGETEEGEEGQEAAGENDDAAAAEGEGGGAAGAADEEEEEELDEEQLAERERVRQQRETEWREKMEEKIWVLQRRQAERDEEKARREQMQRLIDDLVLLKNKEIAMRKAAIAQTTRRSNKERQRRSGSSRLTALDLSGNAIGTEGAAALAQALRHEIPMTEDEIAAARDAAGLPPTGGAVVAEDEWAAEDGADENDNGENNNTNNNNGDVKMVTKTRKVNRQRTVWRGADDDHEEEYEEAEEFEEDEEYEEAEETEVREDGTAEAEEEHGADAASATPSPQQQQQAAFRTTKPGGLKTIQRLGLARCHIGFKGLQAIAAVVGDNCPSLTALDLGNNPTCRKRIPDPVEVQRRKQAAIDQGLAGPDQLSEEDYPIAIRQIVDRTWTSPGAVALADALAKNTTLRHLDLSYNYISPPSLTVLATAGLEKSGGTCALETLVLDGNPFAASATGVSSEGGLALFTLLLALTHTPVRRLSLEGCGVGACIRGATNVLAGLGVLAQQQLLELRLGNNQLGAIQSFDESRCCCVVLPDVTDQLRAALVKPESGSNGDNGDCNNNSSTLARTKLQVLALNDNHFTAAVSAAELDQIVANSPDLESLTLSNNPLLRDEGLNRIFWDGIESRPLKHVNLARCGVSRPETIFNLRSVAWLDLSDCQLSAEGMVAVWHTFTQREMPRGGNGSSAASCKPGYRAAPLAHLALWNAAPTVDPLPLLQAAVVTLSGGVDGVDEKWAESDRQLPMRPVPNLRQVDFGVRPLAGKTQLPWTVNATQGSSVGINSVEASCAMSDLEYMLAKRRLDLSTLKK